MKACFHNGIKLKTIAKSNFFYCSYEFLPHRYFFFLIQKSNNFESKINTHTKKKTPKVTITFCLFTFCYPVVETGFHIFFFIQVVETQTLIRKKKKYSDFFFHSEKQSPTCELRKSHKSSLFISRNGLPKVLALKLKKMI